VALGADVVSTTYPPLRLDENVQLVGEDRFCRDA
jgi:hypothetical protein